MLRSRLRLICALTLVFSFSAQAQAPTAEDHDLLNSERIAQRFGNYGIELLHSEPTLRVSKLFSRHGELQICRTFAVVVYPHSIDQIVSAEHDLILRGGSIGATFAANGWRVTKEHRYLGKIDSTTKLEALMADIDSQKLAVHVYTQNVAKESYEVEYANIVEIHHPDYLELSDLTEIYGSSDSSLADESVTQLLALTADQLR